VVSAAYVDGERFAVFVHGKAELIETAHKDRRAIEQHLTGHYGSSPASWGPAIVFGRVEPSWMVAYAPSPRGLPTMPIDAGQG
jgi:hypothetical protein